MTGTRFLAAAAMVTVVLTATGAEAATITSAQFARDCTRDNRFDVDGSATVQGGVGRLVRFCVIVLDPHETITFDSATLISRGRDVTMVVDGQEYSSVVVQDSTIELSGGLQLSPGCCAGDGEPGHAEEFATTVVDSSTLSGDSVEVSASIVDDGGSVSVTNSTIQAIGSCGCVFIGASVLNDDASVVVDGNTITSSGRMNILTEGAASVLTATDNTFSVGGPAEISAGAGTCTSTGNVPAIPCS